MSGPATTKVGAIYLARARDELERRYRKMRHVVSRLNVDELNWRPNDRCNSVANLVVHFEGNLGERYNRTLGGQEYVRDRDAEFATSVWLTPEAALAKLDEAFPAAVRVVEGLSVGRLTEQVPLPTGPASVVDFLLQTLTHYAEHVGQAIYLAKAQGVELGDLPS